MGKPKQRYLGEFRYPKESTPGRMQTYKGSEEDPYYDVYKLLAFAESVPEEVVSVGSLASVVFKEKAWTDAQGRAVSAEEVLNIIEKNKKENGGIVRWAKLQEEHPDLAYHLEKPQEVDYTTPILLLGENTVVDGVHRLLKAWTEGVNEIRAKRFSRLPESAFLSAELQATLGKK